MRRPARLAAGMVVAIVIVGGCTGNRPYYSEDDDDFEEESGFIGDPAIRPADELNPDGTAKDN